MVFVLDNDEGDDDVVDDVGTGVGSIIDDGAPHRWLIFYLSLPRQWHVSRVVIVVAVVVIAAAASLSLLLSLSVLSFLHNCCHLVA